MTAVRLGSAGSFPPLQQLQPNCEAAFAHAVGLDREAQSIARGEARQTGALDFAGEYVEIGTAVVAGQFADATPRVI